jgi:hypothetical protein
MMELSLQDTEQKCSTFSHLKNHYCLGQAGEKTGIGIGCLVSLSVAMGITMTSWAHQQLENWTVCVNLRSSL